MIIFSSLVVTSAQYFIMNLIIKYVDNKQYNSKNILKSAMHGKIVVHFFYQNEFSTVGTGGYNIIFSVLTLGTKLATYKALCVSTAIFAITNNNFTFQQNVITFILHAMNYDKLLNFIMPSFKWKIHETIV